MFTNGKIIVKFINLWYNFIYIFTFVNHTLEIKTTWLIIVSKRCLSLWGQNKPAGIKLQYFGQYGDKTKTKTTKEQS
jgi:hypothetical protein